LYWAGGDHREEKLKILPYLTKITLRLIKIFNPDKIFLFGSYAWGAPNGDSDLDLLVLVSHHQDTPSQRATIAYRGLRNIPLPLDILVKTRLEFENFLEVPPSLESKIVSEGICLYECQK
jgi:predicted nucleotidyltransferase